MVGYVLDTGMFFRPDELRRIASSPVRVVIPAVVYMERARQLVAAGRDVAELDRWLAYATFEVEPFGRAEALRVATRRTDDARWGRLFRDAMITSHIGPGDVLWTTNPKDFLALGLEADQVMGV